MLLPCKRLSRVPVTRVHHSLEQFLTPYFENIFSEWSFGFRTKKSCHDAIKHVKTKISRN
ncbi:MAG: hypothetical protein Q8754_03020 [Sweet potato little leaf phytoplasma]|nr:hypothetical protein [Sweet potato little leaf phytoplasma]